MRVRECVTAPFSKALWMKNTFDPFHDQIHVWRTFRSHFTTSRKSLPTTNFSHRTPITEAALYSIDLSAPPRPELVISKIYDLVRNRFARSCYIPSSSLFVLVDHVSPLSNISHHTSPHLTSLYLNSPHFTWSSPDRQLPRQDPASVLIKKK